MSDSMFDPNGAAGLALASLSLAQSSFLDSLPKAEMHAHLNGCIPLECLQQLARDHASSSADSMSGMNESIRETLDMLSSGVTLDQIEDFFSLFPAIYALTSTPTALRTVTRAVLASFLGGETPQASYLELRTTPRATESMLRREYLLAVLEEVRHFDNAALIVSVDRRMDVGTVEECITLASELKNLGHPVVGIDLCGDPTKGDMTAFRPLMQQVHRAGLGLTVHVAETKENTDTDEILSWKPQRLGHATFLNEAEMEVVAKEGMAIEICLSSNLQCKTVARLEDHHLHQWLRRNHPIVICTDDTLPFRTTLKGEYALLLAHPPLGLGMSEEAVRKIAESGMGCRFGRP